MARQEKEIDALVARINAFPLVVTYTPLSGEVAFSDYLSLETTVFAVPTSRLPDPFETSKHLMDEANGARACILLPGRRFDVTGTRLGRGGGWYDRFLAAIPETWPRIGVCTASAFSQTPLPRQPWDQPVDVVLVINDEPHVIVTNARPEMVW